MIRKFFIVLFMTHVSSCNNSTCGPECEEIEESPVVSGAQTYSPVATTTTQALTIPYCTTEGQSNCIVDGVNFKAVKPSNIDPWDIRVGKTVGGVQGKLKVNCRNRINSSIYNYDGNIASIGNVRYTSGVSLDIWDTIQDSNAYNAGLPPNIALAWSYDTDCGGIEVSSGDGNVWKDVTTTESGEQSTCSVDSARCTMQDKITGIWWSKRQSNASWNIAWSTCLNLIHNGKDDWRLPTQKELMEAYSHGIRSAASTNWISESSFNFTAWSGSSMAGGDTEALNIFISQGFSNFGTKTTISGVICIR